MSNGIAPNPLNDISKVYLNQVAESAVPGKPAERLGAVTAIPKAEQDAARERILAKTKAKREQMKTEALDPVGQEDADIDNDGDTDKSDKYLHNRRKAIAKAMKKNIKKVKESKHYDPMEDPDFDHDEAEENRGVSGKNNPKGGKVLGKKKSVKEGFSNWRQDLVEVMDDDEDNKEIKEKKVNNKVKINPKLGEAVEEIGGTLLEMVEIEGVLDEFTKNELLLLSDTLIEEVVEEFFYECLEEGYEVEDVEEILVEALDISADLLNEAKVTLGHDTKIKSDRLAKVKSTVKKVGRAVARGAGYAVGLAKRAGSAAKSEFKSGYERGKGGSSASDSGSQTTSTSSTTKPKRAGLLARIGSKLKSGLKKAVASGARAVSRGARNVARKMEGGETKKAEAPKAAPKKAEKPADPWEGSATTPPKAKAKKAAAPKAKAKAPAKKKKSGNLDNLLASIRSEGVEIDEAGDWWHPDPEQDKKLPGRGPKLRAREDRAAASQPKKDYSKSLKPGETYMQFAKRKEAERMRKEEVGLDELYKGKHGQSDKEYADSRSPGGKMVSGDSKQSGAEYTHGRRVKAANPGMQPDVGGKTKPKSQGKMDRGTRADLEYRKANLKKEETGQIDEKITAKTDMGTAIKDFYASKSPQLAGRTKEERRKAAIAAVLTARRGGKKLGEQMGTEPEAPAVDKKKEMMDKQKLANMKMLQQKQQMLQRQRLQMQKTGKLPLESN